jgi:pSer/pThr/pTyr-binding forkhead associated (FHA) protein
MSELTLTIIRLGLLVLLWIFVFSVVGVLRGDIYGTRVVSRTPRKPTPAKRQPARAAAPSATPTPAPATKGRTRGRQPAAPRTLVVTQGALTGTSLPLREAGTVIGRNPECALVLDDDFASGRHARIFSRDGAWFVEDLGSTNGTFLGSERLTGPVRVEVGTTLRIGKTVIELRK